MRHFGAQERFPDFRMSLDKNLTNKYRSWMFFPTFSFDAPFESPYAIENVITQLTICITQYKSLTIS